MNIIRKRDHASTHAEAGARLASRRAARKVRRTIAFEHLERRLALATIQWDGGAGADNPYWDLAANWEGDRVPGGNDDASILAPGTNVTLRSGNVTVKSLTSTAGISLTSGSLNVTQGASLLSGSLFVAPGTYLNASGGSLTATGPTVADSASFYASGGGVLSLPALVSYSAAGGGYNPVIQANDAGSRINLAAVERLWGRTDSGQLAIRAYNGARVDLSGVTNYEGGAVNVLA
ncbi:MAG: hypothetical protein SFX72_05970, partial [Isosphaeraceae bacterium]|nr:hypothetical protein [Isosphaeraceae bacterium]